MSFWSLIVGVVVIVAGWLIFRRIFITPGEREYEELIKARLNQQAQKRNGSLTGSSAKPMLTVPYKSTQVELSFVEGSEDSSGEYTYARFKTDTFTDKKFNVVLNSSGILKKPLVIGTRIAIDDEAFSRKFIVTGNDSDFATKILNQGVRDWLLQQSVSVKFGRRIDSWRLSREKGWLTVFTAGLASESEVFDQLIETSILFYERLTLVGAAANNA